MCPDFRGGAKKQPVPWPGGPGYNGAFEYLQTYLLFANIRFYFPTNLNASRGFCDRCFMGLGNVAIDHVIRPIKLKITNIFFNLAQKLQVVLMYFKAQSIVTRATSIYLFIVTYISNRSWTEKIAFPFQNITTLSITSFTIILYVLTKSPKGFL